MTTKDLEQFVHFVDCVLPISNSDDCEDVAGGLEVIAPSSCTSVFQVADPSCTFLQVQQ